MTRVSACSALVVLDASVIVGGRRMDEAGQTLASVRAGLIDAHRVCAAVMAFGPAFHFALVDI